MKLLTSSKNMLEVINSLGINTSEDLIEYLPYRYDVFSYTDDSNLVDKQKVVLLGKVVSNPKVIHNGKYDIITFFFVSTNNKFYNVKIFNQSYINKMLNFSDFFTLVGTYSKDKNEINITKVKKGEIPLDERFVPIYHLPNAIRDVDYRKLVKRTLDEYGMYIGETLPQYLVSKYHLLNHHKAIKMVHFPRNQEELNEALRTLKFEECLSYCFKNKLIREENKSLVKDNSIEIDTLKINEMIKNLEYKLTEDQTKAVREIVLDMKKKSLMYRLLQGDVGTGKTLVAGISLYANYLRKKQGVLMAPTDSLARQHYDNLVDLFKGYDIKIALLVGSMSEKEKKVIKNEIARGEVDIIIGTHAVFSASSEYLCLGLAIIDEQHRFGVNQRNLLASKGDEVDLLLMSATPIPRTLSLSLYGDLDVSTLAKFPNKKRSVKTLVEDYNSMRIRGLIDYCLKNKRQVFMVCPKINSKNYNDFASVEKIYEKYLPYYGENINLLHGKMKSEEKTKILDDFKKGIKPILVATSIVELGIDVKTAGGIIIFDANSFGLASLHQLRGRVGRDGDEGYCILVDDLNEGNIERLKFLEKCSDGFEIAEEDMRLRGPGDFIGLEQSGFPSFSCLNIVSDFKMFEIARDESSHILNNLNDEDNKKYYLKIKEKLDNSNKELTLFD